MEKKYAFYLIIISFILCNAVAFLDEGLYSFNYLTQLADWAALAMYTCIFLILPVTILLSTKKEPKQGFYASLFGFAPILLLILIML